MNSPASLTPSISLALTRPFVLSDLLGTSTVPRNPLTATAPRRLIERTLLAIRSVTQDPPDGRSSAVHAGTTATTSTSHAPTGGPPSTDPPEPAAAPPEASLSMEELVREHADAVYRVALSVTRDPILAEDASQDALIKAWQSLPKYRGEAPLRHWILRIAHNTSISLLRKRRDEVIAPFDMPDVPASGRTVERQVQDRLAIDRFEGALEQLDGLSRSIVVLREVEGLSYHEMSAVLELPLPTIRTRLLRARRQLAHALEGWQP